MEPRHGGLKAVNLSKSYRRGSEEIHAVFQASLELHAGEFVSFIGPSGSGKTTLVNLLGCLDNPSSGDLEVNGRTVFGHENHLSERELTKIRRTTFGYVFQSFYLIPTLTVRENVELPLAFYAKPKRRHQAEDLLKMLGINDRQHHLPGQISGGEMQRVAIARALINEPAILLADEPTGNLDSQRSTEIVDILDSLSKQSGLTVVMVTHNVELARRANRIYEMKDGRLLAPKDS